VAEVSRFDFDLQSSDKIGMAAKEPGMRDDVAESAFDHVLGGRQGVLKRLLKTFSAQWLDLILRILQQLIVVPVLISHWGADLYQDWIILFSATSFLILLDFGMQTYFVNCLLIAFATRDTASFRRNIAVAMTLYAVVLLVALAILASSVPVVTWPQLLGLRVMDSTQALWCGTLLICGLFMLMPLGIFTGVYRVRGDYTLSIVTGIFTQTLAGYALCLIALNGGAPIMAAAMYFIISPLAWGVIMIDQRRRYGEFFISMAVPTRSELRAALSKSSQYMAPSIAAPIVLHLPIVLLGIWGAPGAAITYAIARSLTGFVRQLTLQPNFPLGVEMAHFYAVGDARGVRKIFLGAAHLTSGICGLFSGLILVIAEPAFRIWTRGQISYDPLLIGIFIATIMLLAPAQVPFILFYHINRPRILVVANTAFACGTVALCLLLVGKYSAIGAALATGTVEFCCIGLLLPFAACRLISVRASTYFANCAWVLSASLALGWGAAWVLAMLIGDQSLWGLIKVGALWVLAVSAPAFFLLLTSDMRQDLRNHLPGRYLRIFDRGRDVFRRM
jgi:O-antigen/teichoic acid export membrane protein